MMHTLTSTNGVHHATDEAIDSLYSWWPGLPPAPAPCPEALFSLTIKGHIDGHEALLTARGMTAAEFRANLAAIRGLLDAPQTPQGAASPPPASTGQGWCAVHGIQMQDNQGTHLRRDTVIPQGVPAVLEQKTTILWKCLYLLASLKDFSGLDVT